MYRFAVSTLWAACAITACGGERVSSRYLGITVANPTGSADISSDGLVAAYDMETLGADGKLRDFSGNGNHGELIRRGSTEGLFGRAILFSQVDDRIDLPEDAPFDLSGPLTVAVWVEVRTLGLHQHIFACDDKFALWVTPQNQFRLGDTQGNGYSTEEGLIEADTWYSVVGVLYGTRGNSLTPQTIQIFVDGSPTHGTADPTWSPTVLHPDDACHIGFESHQGNVRHQELQFEGVIDEILVFDRALTDREIRTHATKGTPE